MSGGAAGSWGAEAEAEAEAKSWVASARATSPQS